MSITSTSQSITAEQFELLDEDARYELIRGELNPMPPMPGEQHGEVTIVLSSYATLFVLEHNLGRCYAAETRFIVARDPDTVLGPDWAFISRERLQGSAVKGFVPLVPDLVLEVRSPHDRPRAVQDKVDEWLSAGVRIVWELNPSTRILTVHRTKRPPRELSIDSTLTGDEVLPGFALPLRRLFPDDPS